MALVVASGPDGTHTNQSSGLMQMIKDVEQQRLLVYHLLVFAKSDSFAPKSHSGQRKIWNSIMTLACT